MYPKFVTQSTLRMAKGISAQIENSENSANFSEDAQRSGIIGNYERADKRRSRSAKLLIISGSQRRACAMQIFDHFDFSKISSGGNSKIKLERNSATIRRLRGVVPLKINSVVADLQLLHKWVLVLRSLELSAGIVKIFHDGQMTFLRGNINSNNSKKLTENRGAVLTGSLAAENGNLFL